MHSATAAAYPQGTGGRAAFDPAGSPPSRMSAHCAGGISTVSMRYTVAFAVWTYDAILSLP